MKNWFKRGMRIGAKDSAIVFSNEDIVLSIPSCGMVPTHSSTTAMAVYWLLGNDAEFQAKAKAKVGEMLNLIQREGGPDGTRSA